MSLNNIKHELDDFLSKIFSEKHRKDDEHTVIWSSTKSGVQYPTSMHDFLKTANSGRLFSAYFGTSTMTMMRDGRLLNRQDYFCGYYVIVLDDVGCGEGSKKTLASLPTELKNNTSYAIETSPGNLQIGFILKEPLRDKDEAKKLQRDIIVALGTDSGGLMINKAVRLPFGYNLKTVEGGGYKYVENGKPFQSRLVYFNKKTWDPDELRAAAGVTELNNTRHAKVFGTALLAKDHVYFVGARGCSDPVFEWLISTNRVINEGVDWITIDCPFYLEHTDKNEKAAGYSPLGYGDRASTRGFHCFHDSCSDKKTGDFLTWVYQKSGIRASIGLGVSEFIARYAFVTAQNSVVDMLSGDLDVIGQKGFKNQLSGLIPVPQKKGLKKGEVQFDHVSEYLLYMTDTNRLRINDLTHRPGEGTLIERGANSYPNLNLYQAPNWPRVSFIDEKIKPFIEFINYLCPDSDDADWLLSHIAAKAQNVKYRGLGVIMSTPVEGTGRGTLSRIISRLWSHRNVVSLSLSALIAGASSEKFNAYMVKDWLIVSEAKDCKTSAKEERTSYESLKSFIELNDVELIVSDKWVRAYSAKCYGSVIICSQHADVVPGDLGMTRFKRILNTRKPWPRDKWLSFYNWLDSDFESQVWSWLLTRDLSKHETIVREKPRSLREEAINAIEFDRAIFSALALCLLYADEKWCGLVKPTWCVSAVATIAEKIGIVDIYGWEKILKRQLVIKTSSISWRPRILGIREKFRGTVDYNNDTASDKIITKSSYVGDFLPFVTKFYADEGL